ncbi:MAG: oligosaccharide flippase family protein [Bacteroidota bacterium]
MESLRETLMSGGRWMILRQVLGQSVRLIISILLTRIIAPEDFGVVAKAIAVTGIVELIFIHGLFGSIVRSDSLNNDQLNYLFIFSLIISLIITSLLFFLAEPISLFYDDDRIIWVVRIAALSVLVSGIKTVFNALLTREMRFKQLAIVNIAATVFASSLTLLLALLDFGT